MSAVAFGDSRLPARFWAKVQDGPGCWLWVGGTNQWRYGGYYHEGGTRRAHRVAYAVLVGPIPEGYQIDHMCFERACVNPAHLQAVSPKANQENRRGAWRRSASGVRGVHWDSSRKQYQARVTHNHVAYHAGRFDTIEEAERAVIALRNRLFSNNLTDRATG